MPTWIFSAIGAIKDNWKLVTIAIVALVVVVYIQTLRLDIAHKETQIVQLEADNQTLKQNVESLQTAISTQNAAISKIDSLATLTQKNFAKLGVDVAAQNQSLAVALSDILRTEKPKTCEEALLYLVKSQKGAVK